ncbi:hypothetical protein GGI43DRAFT_283658 [Trichoderma evansii]
MESDGGSGQCMRACEKKNALSLRPYSVAGNSQRGRGTRVYSYEKVLCVSTTAKSTPPYGDCVSTTKDVCVYACLQPKEPKFGLLFAGHQQSASVWPSWKQNAPSMGLAGLPQHRSSIHKRLLMAKVPAMDIGDRSSHLAFSPLASYLKAGKNGGGQVSMQGQWKQQGILSIQDTEDAPSRHINRQHGLTVQTATSPHHQFPSVGYTLYLEQKTLHHKPWRGAKGRGEEVRASWPPHEIAVRGARVHRMEEKQKRTMMMKRKKTKR